MKVLTKKLAIVFGVLCAISSSAFAVQTATGPVTLWSLSQTPGFSLISVGGGDGGSGSVLCAVDATSVVGNSIMTSAASAAAQSIDVSLTCSDAGQVQQMQIVASD